MLWKLRNDVVFIGALPKIDHALLLSREEANLWMLAGTKGLSWLIAAQPDG